MKRLIKNILCRFSISLLGAMAAGTASAQNYVGAATVATLSSAPTVLNGPNGLAVDGSGDVLIANTGDNRVVRWHKSSNTTDGFANPPPANGVVGLAIDDSGYCYVASPVNNSIWKFFYISSASSSPTPVVTSGLTSPYGVAVNPANPADVFIADNADAPLTNVLDWNGSTLTALNFSALYPTAIARDSSGNLYLADFGHAAIKKRSAVGGAVTTLLSSQTGVWGLAVDGAGNVYFSDANHGAIKKWTAANGNVTSIVTGLNAPTGVALDAAGNVYFSDSGNNLVKELQFGSVDVTTRFETAAAGADSLPPVLPATVNLNAPFAPTSDQPWLTIGSVSGGVVSFNFTANAGANFRVAHINILGQSIAISQAGSAGNAGLVVTSASDSGAGSLRDTVATAPDGSKITFAPNLSGQTITLNNGELLLNKSLIIDGSALNGGVTLNGGGNSRVFKTAGLTTNVLIGLTISNGFTNGNGGGILVSGTLIMNACTIVSNAASYGGGIDSFFGVLSLTNCTVAGNSAQNEGGGLRTYKAALTHCTISANKSGNRGGGVRSDTTNFFANYCIIAGNSFPPGYHDLDGYFNLTACITSGNPVLGALGSHGGPTPTMSPLPGSPAIDAAIGSPATMDQRGYPRPSGPAVDIGAVEDQAGTIRADQNPNGNITPSGYTTVPYGGNQTYTITPANGYHVATLTVDNNPVLPATSYTFQTVTASHTITATFAPTLPTGPKLATPVFISKIIDTNNYQLLIKWGMAADKTNANPNVEFVDANTNLVTVNLPAPTLTTNGNILTLGYANVALDELVAYTNRYARIYYTPIDPAANQPGDTNDEILYQIGNSYLLEIGNDLLDNRRKEYVVTNTADGTFGLNSADSATNLQFADLSKFYFGLRGSGLNFTYPNGDLVDVTIPISLFKMRYNTNTGAFTFGVGKRKDWDLLGIPELILKYLGAEFKRDDAKMYSFASSAFLKMGDAFLTLSGTYNSGNIVASGSLDFSNHPVNLVSLATNVITGLSADTLNSLPQWNFNSADASITKSGSLKTLHFGAKGSVAGPLFPDGSIRLGITNCLLAIDYNKGTSDAGLPTRLIRIEGEPYFSAGPTFTFKPGRAFLYLADSNKVYGILITNSFSPLSIMADLLHINTPDDFSEFVPMFSPTGGNAIRLYRATSPDDAVEEVVCGLGDTNKFNIGFNLDNLDVTMLKRSFHTAISIQGDSPSRTYQLTAFSDNFTNFGVLAIQGTNENEGPKLSLAASGGKTEAGLALKFKLFPYSANPPGLPLAFNAAKTTNGLEFSAQYPGNSSDSIPAFGIAWNTNSGIRFDPFPCPQQIADAIAAAANGTKLVGKIKSWLKSAGSCNCGDVNDLVIGNVSLQVQTFKIRLAAASPGKTAFVLSGSATMRVGSKQITPDFVFEDVTNIITTPTGYASLVSSLGSAFSADNIDSFVQSLASDNNAEAIGNFILIYGAEQFGAAAICQLKCKGADAAKELVKNFVRGVLADAGATAAEIASALAALAGLGELTDELKTLQNDLKHKACPLVSVTVNSTNICAGASAKLTALVVNNTGTLSYSWDHSGGTTKDIQVSPASTTTYEVMVIDSLSGCTNYGVGTVTVSPLPAGQVVTATSPAICSNSPVTIGLAGSDAGITYLLQTNATLGKGTQFDVASGPGIIYFRAVTPKVMTTYFVLATNSSGCSVVMGSTNISVNPLPTNQLIGASSPRVCAGMPVIVSLSSSAIGTTYLLQTNASLWVGTVYGITNGTGIGVRFPAVNPSVPTTYYVLATNTTGCSLTIGSTNITASPVPAVHVVTASSPAVCSNSPVTIGLADSDAGIIYLLQTNAVLGRGTQFGMASGPGIINFPAVTPKAMTTYFVLATNSSGCSVVMGSTNISVNPLPTNQLIGASSPRVCAGMPVIVSLSSSAIGTTYLLQTNASLWVGTVYGITNGTGAGVRFPAVNPSVLTTYYVLATNATDCRLVIGSTNIMVSSLPTGQVVNASSPAICSNAPVVIGLNGSESGVTYWLKTNVISGSSFGTVSGSGAAVGFPPVSPRVMTTYYVVATNASGCSVVMGSTNIMVNPLPSVTLVAMGPTSFCSGGAVDLVASGADTYGWFPTNGITAYAGNAVTVSPSKSITYGVIGTNASGCISAAKMVVTVIPMPVIIRDTTNQNVCDGSPVTWSVTNSIKPVTYQWQRNGTNLINNLDNFTGVNTATLTNRSVRLADAQDTNMAPQGYACIITSGGVCSVSSTRSSLTVNALPTLSISGQTNVCSGESTLLFASSSPGTLVSWDYAGNHVSGSTFASPALTQPLAVTVTAKLANPPGCSVSKIVTLNVVTPITLGMTFTNAKVAKKNDTNYVVYAPGGQNVLMTVHGGTHFKWVSENDPATTFLDSSNLQVTVLSAVAKYYVTASSPKRCLTLGQVTIYPTLPTTTPDGMAFIPAGSNVLGNVIGDADIGNANPVTNFVSAFYMDTNLVSFALWGPGYQYATNHGYAFANSGSGKAANHPVQSVDWYDSVKWCNARSEAAGLMPVYYTDAGFTQVFKQGDTGTTVYQNQANNGYRLPTEAEWEKAARGGLSGKRFPWGDTISESQANYSGETSAAYDLGPDGWNVKYATGNAPYTSPVGSFAANGYGLYDMAGNLFEWCWDWYGVPYGQPSSTDPTGAESGSNRVLRGGSWNAIGANARCAQRVNNPPNVADLYSGFRCVRGF